MALSDLVAVARDVTLDNSFSDEWQWMVDQFTFSQEHEKWGGCLEAKSDAQLLQTASWKEMVISDPALTFISGILRPIILSQLRSPFKDIGESKQTWASGRVQPVLPV
jgi:hypothetical protein